MAHTVGDGAEMEEIYKSIVTAGSDFAPFEDSEGCPSTPTHDNEADYGEDNEETPNGSVEFWIPEVHEELKPVLNSVWQTVKDALDMYEKYAHKAGFVVRKSSVKYRKDRTQSNKYYLCNKEGNPKKVEVMDTLSKNGHENPRAHRNSNFTVTGCKARIKLKNKKDTDFWVLYEFEEKHNHPLIDESNKHLSKPCRKLLYEDEVFIQNVSTNNIGATKAYRLRAAMKGGYENVSGTVVDYKNSKRAINLFVGNRDAQMLVDKFRNRVTCLLEFSFDFKCEKNELICVFWVDETSRCNYREFGDVIAFDATYNTNKYKMVFVLFTGVGNHNRCVTFRAGLLKNEDIPSYSWLLKVVGPV